MTTRESTLREPVVGGSIIGEFLARTRHAPAAHRAEAAAALARSYLYGDLRGDDAWEAKTALLALLDDPSPLVRRALAEACADSGRTPRPLAVALACDAPEVARPVLARSPVLTDADLVDAAALGDEAARMVIALRHHLPPAVSGALAEIGGPDTLVALAGNPTARITAGRMLRMVERHGALAALREALLARPDLPPEVRHAVGLAVARALAAFVTEAGWLGAERCARMGREAGERAALEVCDGAGAAAVGRLVRHLRASHQLTAGLILRALLSGREDFSRAAFADLSGLDHAAVARAMRDARGYADLHRKAGLAEALLPAMQAALSAWREAPVADARAAGLSRRMVERAIDACEALPGPEMRAITALLTRYEAEAARDEAREAARAVAAQAAAREAAHRAERANVAAWHAALESQRRADLSAAEARSVEGGAVAATAEPEGTLAPVEAAATPDVFAASAAEAVAEPVAATIVEATAPDAVPEPAPRAEPGPETAPGSDPAEPFNPVGAILDALPDQILERFRAERRRPDEAASRAAAAAVLDGLGADLLAQYHSGRDTAARVTAQTVDLHAGDAREALRIAA